jgi:hypothetical protein
MSTITYCDCVSDNSELKERMTFLQRGCELHDPDPATIDIPQRLWVGGGKSRPTHLRFFSKKIESDLDQKLRARLGGTRACSHNCMGQCPLSGVKRTLVLAQMRNIFSR